MNQTLAPVLVFKVYFKTRVIENISLYGRAREYGLYARAETLASHMDQGTGDHSVSKLGKAGPS